MMKIKKNIFDSINKMNAGELAYLYEQVRFLEERKPFLPKKKQNVSIEQILEMTESSKSRWSDTVIEEREERI